MAYDISWRLCSSTVTRVSASTCRWTPPVRFNHPRRPSHRLAELKIQPQHLCISLSRCVRLCAPNKQAFVLPMNGAHPLTSDADAKRNTSNSAALFAAVLCSPGTVLITPMTKFNSPVLRDVSADKWRQRCLARHVWRGYHPSNPGCSVHSPSSSVLRMDTLNPLANNQHILVHVMCENTEEEKSLVVVGLGGLSTPHPPSGHPQLSRPRRTAKGGGGIVVKGKSACPSSLSDAEMLPGVNAWRIRTLSLD